MDIKEFIISYIQYCQEDNEKLANDNIIWLSDFIDKGNRTLPLEPWEFEVLDSLKELTKEE